MTAVVTPLIGATCKNTCETSSRYWPLARTMAKMMLRFQVWTPLSWKRHVLKLAELPEALAIVQAARREASDSNRHSRASPGSKGKSRQPFGRQRVPNNARDQRQSDDRPAQVVGRTQRPRPQPQQCGGTELQAEPDKRKARSVCRVARLDIRQETLGAQVVMSM